MDYRSLVNKLEAISNGTSLSETTAPTVFKPTHFHKGNLGNKNPIMQTPDGNWWWETIPTGDDGSTIRGSGKQIAPWQGNTENRSAWNPASIDGVITPDGKYIDFPEGVSWKQYKEKQDADSNAALMAKLKQLIELVDKYMALKAKRSGQGARPAGPVTTDIGDGSKLTVDPKSGNVASTNDDGTPYVPGSNPNLPKNKAESKLNIAQSLVESFGYSTQVEAAAIPAGAAAGIGSKVLGKALPGVGAVLGAQGAYDSYQKGDYLGAALNGLSGAFSLVPGVGWIPALGFGAWQAGRELSGVTDKYNTPPEASQGARPGAKDNKVLAIQKKILAKDPKALPKHGADGKMGPETQAAMARLKIQESIVMTQPKSLAESIRELQQRLEMIESSPVTDSDQSHPASPEEQAIGAEIEKAGGKLYQHPNGNEYIVLPDGITVVDAVTQEIVDASTEAMTPTGKTFDPASLSESMDLDEGVWDKIFKGAVNAFKTGSSGAKVATGNLTRAGKPQVVGQNTKVFKKQLATQPAVARGAYRAGQGVNAIKNNPLAAAAGLGAAGVAGGYAAGKLGSDDTVAPNTPVAPNALGRENPHAGQGGYNQGGSSGQGGQPNAPAEDDAEMKALRAQIDALIKDLSSSQDPAIQKGLADINAKLK